jgi:hypothetical protein
MEEAGYRYGESFQIPPAFIAVFLILALLAIIGFWRMFEKAGRPGWESLIPIYNVYMMCKIGGTKNWGFIFIPFLNIIWLFVIYINLAKSFGRGTAFGVGLTLLTSVFAIILGFSRSIQYIGPGGVPDMTDEINSMGQSGNT